MKNTKILVSLSLCASTLLASGYRIPEQSSSAVALSAANVAAVNSADASYYNPANMSFMDSIHSLDFGLQYIHLPSAKFKNNSNIPGTMNSTSEKENFLMPTLFFVTPFYGDWRIGVSVTAPAGLAKRWYNPYGSATARKFALKVVELNPSASYLVNEKLSLAFGLRLAYSEGDVKSDATALRIPLSRDMKGDSIDFGYNLALTYKPIEKLRLAATYRSKIDLTIEGDARLNMMGNPYSGKGSVKIPLPATLNLAIAYDFGKTIVEFGYEREFWSSYKDLDFDYPVKLPVFDAPVYKGWKDSDTFKLGVTHKLNDKLKLMAGFAYDKNPVAGSTLGFELPDSDGFIYSAGFERQVNDSFSFGLGYLYADKKNRKINNPSNNPITTLQGEFSGNSAHILNSTIKYRF